jgi:hypothetical protein
MLHHTFQYSTKNCLANLAVRPQLLAITNKNKKLGKFVLIIRGFYFLTY